jgi:glycosyltransferase involved in cell wall biosynthesis
MLIAVNTSFPGTGSSEVYDHYVKEIVGCLVQQHPEHGFVYVTANTGAWAPTKPDIWVTPYNHGSLRRARHTILVVHDLSFVHYPQFAGWWQKLYYKLFMPGLLRKAKKIITVSAFSKNAIIERYKIPAGKIAVVHGAAGAHLLPLSWEEKEAVKNNYTADREYFLAAGDTYTRDNLLTLLKAFSLFKKWQRSNMKLLVIGNLALQHSGLAEKLKTYKYREDVVLAASPQEETSSLLIAAAYALLHTGSLDGSGLAVLDAMQCEVPVITSHTAMPEISGEAALYTAPDDPDALAKQMLTLYKDEDLRSRFIKEGKERVRHFSWEQAAAACWQEIIL